ncbi:desaturase [Vandammella animalimorsus]|uniref:Desaturase n=1 Tax=Vandammella animalimorsus TaxID=2029117 RepID=A0A3M6RT26_9BURK|nr:hydroxysqualene dehydroxylase HpnE [Vandammella animalimorsus]RMX18639.1 desaturase [Vandammella animalimorsus]
MRLAVVGAGWAGLAAAVAACQAGAQPTLFEASRQPGGRARNVALAGAGGQPALRLDNGQHILIGAYRASLGLMHTVGLDAARCLQRLPLDLRDAQGQGLALPAWPSRLPEPLQASAQALGTAWALLRAQGWSWGERLALLRRLQAWQRAGFACAPTASVAQLCAGLPPAVVQQLIEPLCTAALNTPLAQASGAVFLRVLQDSVAGGPGSADLLLPTVPLGDLLAEPAWRWLQAQGAQLRLGQRIGQLQPAADSQAGAGWLLDGQRFDAVLLATPAGEALRLLRPLAAEAAASAAASAELRSWLQQAEALRHEAIGTVFLRAADAVDTPPPAPGLLARPMLALAPGGVAQYVFDRQQLTGEPGLLAWVASTLDTALDKAALTQRVLAQAQALPGLAGRRWQPVASIIEKRATFACTAGLQRPGQRPCSAWPRLLVCGDYVHGPYPATLEGAVRSGQQAVAALRRAVAGAHSA